MGLPRTFVGFSSTDIKYYHLMLAWKDHVKIDFDFCDCQLPQALNSENEDYIKRMCRERINMAGTYIMLIGEDTRYKHKYVLWEADVAIEKGCRIIGVNLDYCREMNPATCASALDNIGAMFVPFSPHNVAHALEHAEKRGSGNWRFEDDDYNRLGYVLIDNRAMWPSSPYSNKPL
jgi:hypothetical protein